MKITHTLIIGMALMTSACTEQQFSVPVFSYDKRLLEIKDGQNMPLLDTTEYKMELYATLKMPDRYKGIEVSKFEYIDGRFYILDEEYNKTVFVFDSIGNFVASLGEQGRASNEYLYKPNDFFVDRKNKLVNVHEQNARRIHRFSLDGKQTNLINTEIWPYSIGFLSNGHYAAAFDHPSAGKGLQLGVFDDDGNCVQPLINQKESSEFVNNRHAFINKDDKLYHIPNFSDSIIVISGDTISEVIKLKFKSPFINSDVIDDAKNGDLYEYQNFDGVTVLSDYYETDKYISFSYSKRNLVIGCIIDKETGKQYHFTSTPFDGLMPMAHYTINDNIMYLLLTEYDVKEFQMLLGNDDISSELKKTSSVMRKILAEEPKNYVLKVIINQ